MGAKFDEIYNRSLREPEAFWSEAATDIHWIEPWREILDASNTPHLRWFPGGKLNTCFNCVDRHVKAGRGEQVAVIYDSAVTGTQRTLTYRDLQDQVARFAGVLVAQGVQQGDRD